MSISLGIYDVFSYAIPGMMYLFMFNEFLRLLHLPHMDITILKDSALLLLLGLISYLIGHLFDHISHEIWYRTWYPKGQAIEQAYAKFRGTPGVKADFDVNQWSVLFSVIRQNNPELAVTIDRNKATAIMLRNVSFALALLAIVSLINLIATSFDISSGLAVIVAALGSRVSLLRSDKFNVGFYSVIFEQSLLYGNNLAEVLYNVKIRSEKLPETSARARSKRKAEED